jgi:hypothetical protein
MACGGPAPAPGKERMACGGPAPAPGKERMACGGPAPAPGKERIACGGSQPSRRTDRVVGIRREERKGVGERPGAASLRVVGAERATTKGASVAPAGAGARARVSIFRGVEWGADQGEAGRGDRRRGRAGLGGPAVRLWERTASASADDRLFNGPPGPRTRLSDPRSNVRKSPAHGALSPALHGRASSVKPFHEP